MKKILLLCGAFIMALQSWAQMPKADVLDVIFNEDGTATDVSPMANEVIAVGTPNIVASPRWGMNLLCTARTPMGGRQENAYKVMMTDQIWDAVKDGHSIECFVRPFWDGALGSNVWAAVVSTQQFGGTGLLIYNGRWCYEPYVGDGYVEAWGGQPKPHKWVHVVGTFDKAAGTVNIFVDGALVQSVERQGELGRPDVETPFIGIGGDLSSYYDYIEAGFPGDIALARIYSKALNEEEVADLYAEITSKDTGEADHKEESPFSDLRYDENGHVLIATAKELNDYALLTKIAPQTSAKLEADIDYTAYNDNICVYGTKFGGIFDGNGHSVTVNFDFTGVETTGFIADAQSGAEVKNLTLKGNVTGDQRWNGVLFGSNYGAVTRNVTIKANLNNTRTSPAYAGVLSGWDEKTCTYENIVIETTLSGDATHMGALIGDVAGTTYLNNVFVVANSTLANTESNSPLVASPRSGTQYNNVYYVNEYGLGLSLNGGTQLSSDDATNGRACYLLNQGNVINPTFYQKVNEDLLPTFDPTHGVVIRSGDTFLTITDDAASIEAAVELVSAAEAEYANNVEAFEGLKTELAAMAEALSGISDRDRFMAVYDSIQKIRARIDVNITAYETYRETAETIYTDIMNMTGDAALQLLDYINEEIEPNDVYKNGSFVYIHTYKTLDTQDVYGEIAYMEEMQKKISASDAPAGTDVSVLLTNSDFSQGFKGWNGSLHGYGTNGTSWAAEYWGKNNFEIYQEVRGLKNGVYAFSIQGAYRAFDEVTANQYWPCVYANGNINYLQNVSEGMISVEDAVDHENCYITPGADNNVDDEIYDADGKVTGYVCHGIQGCCYAFGAGRYQNHILVNVTDGTLRVGVNHQYSEYGGNEWVSLGNAKLVYCGTIDEAGDYLDRTLLSMTGRIKTLLAYTWSDTETCRWYPNFSRDLKDRLAQILATVEENPTATSAEKYALIEEISQIFTRVKESKLAYRKLAVCAINIYDRVTDYPGHEMEINEACSQTWEEWRNGVYSTPEEVQAKIDQLNAMVDVLPIEIPTPDVFDIVFNADGTAVDKSPLKTNLTAVGETHVVESPVLQQNVFCLAQNSWSDTPQAFYQVEMTDTLQSLLADGITMECLVRPTWNGDIMPSGWASCFGYEESGGLGMIVYGGKWTFEAHVGGGYRDAVGVAPVKDQWVHLVGVWNKTFGKLYLFVNGEFAGGADAVGDLKNPNADVHWMGIGADMPKEGQACFQGDIAIMRLYNDPINASQANKLYQNVKAMMTDDTEHDCSKTTGIIDVEQPVPSARRGIFNIMGRKVNRMTKGIYIVDGKKVLVK